ncbi:MULTISPECIES: hypothetical protein [Herpetosiphon]|uniref:hypothetical protein n=1 Tax=Herpetosiphon TaxID=64 RepID=UPI00195A459E|nr:hypothetical protein [Herpetosiphon giganteus]MBM7845894.1 hypothetical protein [Herpetosiphon giganteus]
MSKLWRKVLAVGFMFSLMLVIVQPASATTNVVVPWNGIVYHECILTDFVVTTQINPSQIYAECQSPGNGPGHTTLKYDKRTYTGSYFQSITTTEVSIWGNKVGIKAIP